MEHVTPGTLIDALRWGTAAERFAGATGATGGAVAVDLDAATPLPVDLGQARPTAGAQPAGAWSSLPLVLVGLARSGPDDAAGPASVSAAWLDVLDVVVDPDDASMDDLDQTLATNPVAATTLALLLRGAERRSVAEGLVAESAAYSTLQAGTEFTRWRASRAVRERGDHDEARVRCQRRDRHLQITLSRPGARNAMDARMAEELCDALLVAALDPDVEQVDLHGEGSSFCAGGDLDEMGTRDDPAIAHLVRLRRSPARLLAAIASRTTAHLHGACVGSGIELPAFAGRVEATPDARFALPEVRYGLVPGAGGTVSLPARIGRHRTAWLALTGCSIDATTAQAWGLVDEVVR